MSVPNPYFIHIELYWPNGTRPNQNEIARVRAIDVDGGNETDQGQSGYDPATGGWQDVFMQNIAGFHPPRDQPNLKFLVEDTQNNVAHTTQVFGSIESGSTVKIVIGQSDELLTTPFQLSYQIPTELELADIAVHVTGANTQFNNGVNITTPTSGEFGRVVNVGPHQLFVGDNNQTGSIWSVGPVTVGASSHIYGDVKSGSSATTQSGVVVDGQITQQTPITLKTVTEDIALAPRLTAYEAVTGAETQAGGTNRGDVHIQNGGALTLTTGYHYFDKLRLDNGGSLKIDASGGVVEIVIHTQWDWNGAMSFIAGDASKVRFIYLGTANVSLQQDLSGTIVAPSGYIYFQHAGGFTGAVFASGVTILPMTVSHVPFDGGGVVGPTSWTVAGTVTDLSGQPVVGGTVRVMDLTAGSEVELGTAVPDGAGNYSVTFGSSAFDENGLPHDNPNVLVRYFDTVDILRAQSSVTTPAVGQTTLVIDLSSGSGAGSESYRVEGAVTNATGGVFADTVVRACQLVWTDVGMEEFLLGTVLTDAQGRYVVEYTPSLSTVEPPGCRPPSGEISLVVKAMEGDLGSVGDEITRSAFIPSAEPVEVVDLVLDRPATAVRSEFGTIDEQFRRCLIEREGDVNAIFFHIRDTEGYASFAAHATGVSEETLLPYALAHIVASQINLTIPFGGTTAPYSDFPPISAEAVYPLTRAGLGGVLPDLIRVEPATYLAEVVAAMNEGLIGTSLEPRLNNSTTDSLQKQWGLVRSFFLSDDSVAAVFETDELKLMKLVIPDAAKRGEVIEKQSEHRGDFDVFVHALEAEGVLSAAQAEDLIFAFQFFGLTDQHLPLTEVVYGLKSSRGWNEVRDLLTVTLKAEAGVDGWQEIALAQLNVTDGEFPEDIFGRDDAEKATAHARRIIAALEAEFPQGKYETEIAAVAAGDAELEEVVQFLSDYPDFDLAETQINAFLQASGASLSDEAVARLKSVQRLRRVTKSYEEATALQGAGFDSAVAIAQIEEDTFIAENEEALGGFAVARRIHRKAKRIAGDVMGTVARFHENLNNSGDGLALPPPPAYSSGLAESGNVDPRYASYTALFGNLFNCGSRHCQTVLSPSAYLVDLLQFAKGTPRNLLLERRPDLAEIELNCENTEKVLPYIDLVIEQLGAVIAPWNVELSSAITSTTLNDAVDDGTARALIVAEIVAAAGFRFTKNVAVRVVNGDEWLLEDDHLRFRVVPLDGSPGRFEAQGTPQTSASAELLSVFPEHDNPRANTMLEDAVFPFQLPLSLGRREVDLILKQRGRTRAELLQALPQGLASAGEVPDPERLVEGIPEARAYLGLIESEEKALFSTEEAAHEYWGFSGATEETIPRPEVPQVTITGHWLNLLAEVGVFLHRAQVTYDQLLDLVATEFIHDSAGPVAIIAGDADDGEENARECNYHRFRLLGLSEDVARRVSFFLRLWRLVDWDMRTLDRYLVTLENSGSAGARTPPITVERLARVLQLSKRLDLAPEKVFVLLGELNLHQSERLGASQFARILLKGPQASFGYQLLERVEAGASPAETLVATDEELESLQDNLRTALQIGQTDFLGIWAQLMPSTPFSPTVAQLSQLARVAFLVKALGISSQDYFLSLGLLGVDPFANADVDVRLSDIDRAASAIDFVQKSGLSVALAHYLLRVRSDEADPLVPTAESLSGARTLLAGAGTAILEQYPNIEAPLGEALVPLLAEMVPEEKIPGILQQLASPGAGATDTFQRYFPAFVDGSEADDANFIVDLIGPGSEDGRLLKVASRLRRFLILRARGQAALEAAAELFGLNADATDLILQRALTSSTDGSVSALKEWVGAVGELDLSLEDLKPALDVLPGNAWVSNWVSASDAEVRFVAVLNVEDAGESNNLTFELDETSVGVESSEVIGGQTVVTFSPVSAREGDVRSISFASSSDADLALRARINNDEPSALPAGWFSNLSLGAFTKLQKTAALSVALRLNPTELEALVLIDEERSASQRLLDRLPVLTGELDVPWGRLREFVEQLGLDRTLELTALPEEQLAGLDPAIEPERTSFFELRRRSAEPSAAEVALLTGWDEADISTALSEIWTTAPSFADVRTWSLLRTAVGVASRLDLKLARAYELLVAGPPSTSVARSLRENFRAKFTEKSFTEAFKGPRDKLRQAHRDALTGYLTTRLVTLASGESRHFINENDLYGYFLIDVEMEPDTEISRIKLALLSVQLFIERVFLGLEDRKAISQLEEKKEQWEWMRNFRVWEANRKVFLYPENWIEPQLRDDKSPLFAQAEDELLQQDLDNERAEKTLARFADGLSALSHLTVVAMHSTHEKVYVVARDRAAPYTYYYRTFQRARRAGVGNFTNWTKIDQEIESDFVAVGEVQGALQLFWPIVQEKGKIATSNSGGALGLLAEIRVMWSTLDPNLQEWSKPRLSNEKVLDTNAQEMFDRPAEQDGPETRGYHLRVAAEEGRTVVDVIKTQDKVGFPSVSISVDGGPPMPGTFRDLLPEILGRFAISEQGEETASQDGTELTVGDFYPDRTLVHNNVARQSAYPFEDEDQLRLGGVNYFGRVPANQPFRFVASDLGYFSDADDPTMIFDTEGSHLLGVPRESRVRSGLSTTKRTQMEFITFDHPVMGAITSELRERGPTGIMNRLTQALPTSLAKNVYGRRTERDYNGRITYTSSYVTYGGIYLGYHIAEDRLAWGTTQRDFKLKFQVDEVRQDYPLPTVEFAYGTPYGAYNWELFFHLPMLIADRFAQDMRFEDALKWYHYVFDPRRDLNSYEIPKSWVKTLPPGARYWNFLPFFANRDVTDSLLDVFGVNDRSFNGKKKEELQRIISDWRENPFNPHLIARQRIAAYQKFTVMKYLDTLIGWGDQLFRQDSFESINQATQLYVLAAEILGQRPEVIESSLEEPRASFEDVNREGIDQFSNALVELETLQVGDSLLVSEESLPRVGAALDSVEKISVSGLFFRIPRNEKLDGYWDTVGDRLFKIRNSMNIDGVKRTLALFQPPIDPALLVRARAAGIDLSSALGDLNRPLPHYRFSVWVGQAKELANELKSFSSALLSALEKKDAEELALIRQDHEIRLLKKAREVRKGQLEEAEQNLVALRARRELPLDRIAEYENREPRSPLEETNLRHSESAILHESTAGSFHTVAGALGAIPQITGGFASVTAEFGGQHLAAIYNAIGTYIGTLGGIRRGRAGIVGTIAGYQRRQEDWDLQRRQAELELKDIDEQIIGAEIRVDVARQELESQELQIDQSEQVQDYLKDKFTNVQLYQWMITQLSRTFQQTYRLATDVAKIAEKSFAFELGLDSAQYIEFEYRDSLRKGLLAGEKLFFDLKRMEVAYLQKDKRELEITKPISLLTLNPDALQQLREKGECEFEVPEVLFDLDFPGQYFRRIQAVRLTIPAVTGPYTNVSAKLSLLSSAVRVKGSANPGDYPYQGLDDPRFAHDKRAIQSIATSSAQDDAGLFELNFRDERYLPFEGAGAVSRWKLELPERARQFDYSTISDVVMQMSYTARDAGGSLAEGAKASIAESMNRVLQLFSETETGLVRSFSLKREFPDALHQLLSSGTATLKIEEAHFPYLLRDEGYTLAPLTGDLMDIRLITGGTDDIPATSMTLAFNGGTPGASVSPGPTPDENGVVTASIVRGSDNLITGGSETWTLNQTGLGVGDIEDLVIAITYRIVL